MKKLLSFSFVFTLAIVQASSQSKNPGDYKTNTTGFYENKGQIVDQNYQPNRAVKYLLCQPGLNVQLRQTGFSYDTYAEEVKEANNTYKEMPKGKFQTPPDITRHFHRIDIELVGCNTAAPLLAEDRSEAYYNYFTAGAPKGGVNEVHTYQKVTYKNIYPNIDLQFFCNGTKAVEYNFIIHPGGNPGDIKLQYKGADGTSLQNGVIVIETSNGKVTENIPSSYLADTKQAIPVNYNSVGRDCYGFSISSPLGEAGWGSTDLIIDPTPCLSWGTYYGGTGGEVAYAMSLDASSNSYITGITTSASFIATAGAYKTTYIGSGDVFVSKFNSSGSSLVWGTYYGGTGTETGYGICLDASNNVYITGESSSTSAGISTAGTYQTTLPSGQAGFVAKFNSTGTSLLWGTYYGGTGPVIGEGICVDASNNVYITGVVTGGSGIATAGAYQTSAGGVGDAFVAKFNSTGTTLVWGTYYGGSQSDQGNGIAIDANNNTYITGLTNSTTSMTTAGAYQTVYGGNSDAFVAKFNSAGSALLWGTYYGGSTSDVGNGIVLDASNNVYITGYTYSTSGIATAGAYQTAMTGTYNAFVAKFNPTGSSLLWGTYYGGTSSDIGQDIALGSGNNVYITGYATSSNGIATAGAYQSTYGGMGDAFVAKFDPSGSSRLWGTYYGGAKTDYGYGIAIDASDNVYIAGNTQSTAGIATAGAYQTTNYADNAFVAKFGCNPQPLSINAGSIVNVNCFGSCTGSATANPSGGTAPYTYNWTPSGGTNATASNLCAGSYTCTVKDAAANTVTVSVTITEPTQLRDSISAQTNVPCNGANNGSATVGVKGGMGTYTYNWSPSGGSAATANNLTASGYTVTVTDANGCTATASANITQPTALTVTTTINSNVLCHGGNTGKITANPSGGTGTYTYSWSNGATSAAATGLTAGSYTITVTDANGCTATASATVTEPTTLNVSIGSVTNILCNGGNTGSMTATPSGGTAGYTYMWTPAGQTTANITGLSAGCYTITVTDNNGCTATATTCITQPTALKVSTITANPDSICQGSCSTISVTGTGGTPAYGFLWSTGATTSSVSVCPTSTKTYTVTLTDGHGCTHDSTITVVVDPPPALTLSAAKDSACVSITTDMLTGTPVGGTYSGVGVTGNNFNPNTAGSGLHKVYYTYTDNHGCTNKDSITIKVNLCTGVPEVNLLENEIKFYPNPFSQSINVDNNTTEAVTISMFNIMGQQMGAWQLDKGLNSISTETYPSGVYMLQVKTKDGVLNKKLVKVN